MTAPLFETLEVLDDLVPHDGPLNMALDEMLLEYCAVHPILRIYRWEVPTVSLGYFEEHAGVRQRYPGQPMVRRWTGGGVVEHGADFTYSLLVPRKDHFTRCAVAESYRLIHEAVAAALRHVGFGDASLAGLVQASAGNNVHACFEQPVRHDLMRQGQKIAGAAQRRSRHGLLHQGSVQCGVTSTSGTNHAATFGAILSTGLGANCPARSLHAREQTAAQALVKAKYGTTAWLERF